MSYTLWRLFQDDDVDRFRQFLATATFATGANRTTVGGLSGNTAFKIGSPSLPSTSPRTPLKTRKSLGNTPGTGKSSVVLTRADINARDAFGRTLLHHAASSRGDSAIEFIRALLEVPFIDLYIQDIENGWTPLHRALYHGNVAAAQILMLRDIRQSTDYTINTNHAHAEGLIKIKDHERNSPFEVFGLTIAPRSLQDDDSNTAAGVEEDDGNSVDFDDQSNDQTRLRRFMAPRIDVNGDEAFTFGSNKNLSLGVGNEDDRVFPERIQLQRPEHLLQHLYQEHMAERRKHLVNEESSGLLSSDTAYLPTIIRHKPIVIQDIVMSKFHTAVLTTDPLSNLYVCGFGPGGRLGLGDEFTAFTFKCVQGGGIAKKKISAIALGQDHSIVVSSQSDVYTWGSNKYGQLGYTLPEVAATEVPMQLVPRQLYGYIKKELVVGAAASAIHSAIYTSTGLYTFGKNEGQLGLMDADARSLEMQIIPRRVGVSILSSSIRAVSAIDRATIVLMENHEVVVFTHYGFTRVAFPLEGSMNFPGSAAFVTRHNMDMNYIQKITSGGNTICAMSSFGEVFTVTVPKSSDSVSPTVSTTNPTKARNALPPVSCVWSIKKAHMAAIDVASGQDGSIILCTASGSVWRKEKRANLQTVRAKDNRIGRTKDYKFTRVPNLTRAVAVRGNAFGAFAVIRQDCEVAREQIVVDPPKVNDDLFPLLAFSSFGNAKSVEDILSEPRFWTPRSKGPNSATVKQGILTTKDVENEFGQLSQLSKPLALGQHDLWITSTVTDVKIPLHSFLLKARSRVMRKALTEFLETYYYSIPDVVSIEYGEDGQIHIQFQGADFFTIVNLVFYLYTDDVIGVWHHTSKALHLAHRYRTVRTELMKIAGALEIHQLERAVRVMTEPVKCLTEDLSVAVKDKEYFSDADVLVQLADGAELPAHSSLLCARCPFFDGLFNGRAGGFWMQARRGEAEQKVELMKVDLKHIRVSIFEKVLVHLYADAEEELFDDIVAKDLDEFIDIVVEVMSVANELMIDRLAQICQRVLGRFVTMRNVCSLLNVVAECTVEEFKFVGLEYICLNLEGMLDQRYLEELDPDLLAELDDVVRQNQLAFMPFSRSSRAEDELIDRHPDLIDEIAHAQQQRLDSIRLRSRLLDDEDKPKSNTKLRIGSLEKQSFRAGSFLLPQPGDEEPSPSPSPAILPRQPADDLIFEMDESENALPTSAEDDSVMPVRSTVASTGVDAAEAGASSLGLLGPQIRPGLSRANSKADNVADIQFSTPTKIGEFDTIKLAWKMSPQSARSDLRDIMNQTAASSQSSALSQAFKNSESSRPKPVSKISQRERKRQQLEQQQRAEETTLVVPVSRSQPAPTTASNATPQSPWKAVADKQKTPETSILTTAVQIEATKQNRNNIQPSTPATVPKLPVAGQESRPKVIRDATKSDSRTVTQSSSPQIQSIRHVPQSSRSAMALDARTSMAEILAQQQFEKIAIKEAVAKRSLQEIQQEQEFQEWWDQESQRVQEEEAAQTKAAERRRHRSGRGRGGNRRKSDATAGAVSTEKQAQPATPVHVSAEATRGRGKPGHGAGAAAGGRRGGGGVSREATRGRGRGQ